MRKNLIIFLSLILLVSCQTGNIATDYDIEYDFSNLKTYNYYTDNTIQLNSIDSANLMKSLDEALFSKGLVLNTENPDIFVSLQVYKQDETQTKNLVNLGVGGGGRWFGMGTSVGIPIRSKVTAYSIQLDFDDAKTRTLIWTSKTTDYTAFNASSGTKSKFFKSTFQTLLKKYPPKKRKQKTSRKNNYYN